jgi:hypothetical protein
LAAKEELGEETHLFFDHVLRQNLSILTFIDADLTFVNEPLAALWHAARGVCRFQALLQAIVASPAFLGR